MKKEKVKRCKTFMPGFYQFEELIEEMEKFKKKYPNAITYVDGFTYWIEADCDGDIQFNCEELETDDEYKLRIEEEQRQKEYQEKQDYEKYLELKKRFDV